MCDQHLLPEQRSATKHHGDIHDLTTGTSWTWPSPELTPSTTSTTPESTTVPIATLTTHSWLHGWRLFQRGSTTPRRSASQGLTPTRLWTLRRMLRSFSASGRPWSATQHRVLSTDGTPCGPPSTTLRSWRMGRRSARTQNVLRRASPPSCLESRPQSGPKIRMPLCQQLLAPTVKQHPDGLLLR